MRRNGVVETRRDRRALITDAGFGQVSIGSVISGVLVAYGAFAVLAGIVAAIAKGAGWHTDIQRGDWNTVGTGGGLVVAAVLLVCWLYGGYVAGRMARRAGATHGVLVFVVGLLLIAATVGLVHLFASANDITSNLRDVGIPTTWHEWRHVGTIAGVASLAAMLIGALVGGVRGERWHGRLLARAMDPDVGPAAAARREADDRDAAATDRVRTADPEASGAVTTREDPIVVDDGRRGRGLFRRGRDDENDELSLEEEREAARRD